jgi:hypothetical protein
MARTIPDEFLDLMAEKFRLLGDATRLAILRALMGGKRALGVWWRRPGGGRPTSPST